MKTLSTDIAKEVTRIVDHQIILELNDDVSRKNFTTHCSHYLNYLKQLNVLEDFEVHCLPFSNKDITLETNIYYRESYLNVWTCLNVKLNENNTITFNDLTGE